MPLLRCTKKLQREMGLRPANLAETEPASPLGSWHANLIYIGRRKCVLFVNDRTLFNFIAPDASRAQIRNLASLFSSYLPCVLNEEGLPPRVVERILADSADVSYGSTNNRSVLGSMNDLAFHYELHILDAGGVHSAEVPSIISKLNRMPMSPLKYAYAIEELQAVYAEEA